MGQVEFIMVQWFMDVAVPWQDKSYQWHVKMWPLSVHAPLLLVTLFSSHRVLTVLVGLEVQHQQSEGVSFNPSKFLFPLQLVLFICH